VYNVPLLRQLWVEITSEKDSEKCQELVALLRAVIKEDQEEIRVRMSFLVKKCASVVDGESQAAD
jgi:hypothetical protein